jgi:hypothetical protein
VLCYSTAEPRQNLKYTLDGIGNACCEAGDFIVGGKVQADRGGMHLQSTARKKRL